MNNRHNTPTGNTICGYHHHLQVFFGEGNVTIAEVSPWWVALSVQWRRKHKIASGAEEFVAFDEHHHPVLHHKEQPWQYVLWDLPAVEALVREDYPELWPTFHGYNHWVQRADVARYVILHK